MAQTNLAPRVAVIQDLSGIGRCALSVVLPVLGIMGIQSCPLPTAVLSTHTGGFGRPVKAELTGFMRDTVEHWKSQEQHFQGFYSGYFAEPEQIEIATAFLWNEQKNGDILSIVDPAMADSGRLYSSLSTEMPNFMRELCAHADVITPNLTEAAFLADIPMPKGMLDPNTIMDLITRLYNLGCPHVLITGVPLKDSRYANICAQSTESGFWMCPYNQLPASFPGTGDLFAAVLTGTLIKGANLSEAMAKATGFCYRAVQKTIECATPSIEGLQYESLLPLLLQPETEFTSRFLFR